MRNTSSKMHMDSEFKRAYYVRYADDFVIGLQGSHLDANSFVKHLSDWLEANLLLSLHPDKTHIHSLPVRLYSAGKRNRVTPRLKMTCDLEALFKRLKDRGFVKLSRPKQMHVGVAYGRMQNLDVPDIIRYYNSVFRGLWNYFSFVDNSSSLNKV